MTKTAQGSEGESTGSKRQQPVMTKDQKRAAAFRERRLAAGQHAADAVMRLLDVPSGFLRCDGHWLWGNNYRVNVIVRDTSERYDGCVSDVERVADSYFCVVDNGLVCSCKKNGVDFLSTFPYKHLNGVFCNATEGNPAAA